MQESPRFSEIIREFEQLSVSALFVAAHGRPPTIDEMARVSEFVEEEFMVTIADKIDDILKDMRDMDDYEDYVDDSIYDEPTSTPVAVKTKPKVKKERTYTRRSKADINWKTIYAQSFLDVALDGEVQSFTYKEIEALLPNFPKVTQDAFSNYVRAAARNRGYKTCHVRHNKRLGEVTIHAVASITN